MRCNPPHGRFGHIKVFGAPAYVNVEMYFLAWISSEFSIKFVDLYIKDVFYEDFCLFVCKLILMASFLARAILCACNRRV